MTTVTLLVCGPVLFGLGLILFEPMRHPAWFADFLSHPAKHLLGVIWLLVFSNALLSPNHDKDEIEEGDQDRSKRVWTGLSRIADLVWANALGILFCLIVVVGKDQVDTAREDTAVYIAVGLMLLSIVLRWRDRRERMGFRSRSQPAD